MTKDWGLSRSVNTASSDCSQEPQGQRCLINFTAEADGCVFEFLLQRACEAKHSSWAQTGVQTEALIVKRRTLNWGQGDGQACFKFARCGPGGPFLIKINFLPASCEKWAESCGFRVCRATVRALACFQPLSWKEELMPLEWESTAGALCKSNVQKHCRSGSTCRLTLKISLCSSVIWTVAFKVVLV